MNIVITMARERPIKLHIKDGKTTTFRLIGPRGRVLNTLSWDGEALELRDASDVEDSPEEATDNVEIVQQEAEGDENLENILGSEPPSSPAPDPLEKDDDMETPEVGPEEGVEDVSGEPDAAIDEAEIAKLLSEDTSGLPDEEESDEVPSVDPEAEDDSTDTDEEKKKKD